MSDRYCLRTRCYLSVQDMRIAHGDQLALLYVAIYLNSKCKDITYDDQTPSMHRLITDNFIASESSPSEESVLHHSRTARTSTHRSDHGKVQASNVLAVLEVPEQEQDLEGPPPTRRLSVHTVQAIFYQPPSLPT